MAAKTRLTHLRQMVRGAEQRMADPTCSDQNFAVLGRMRNDFLAEIEELTAATKKPERTGLSDFEHRLRAREQRAKSPRRASGG